MTLLGGLFKKKHRSSASRQLDSQTTTTTTATDDVDHSQWSPTDDSYVTPDIQSPSVPNGRSFLHPDAARTDSRTTSYSGYHSDVLSPVPSRSSQDMPSSSSKLRLPFGRKKSAKPLASGFASAPEDDLSPPGVSPRPPFMSRTSTSSAVSSDPDGASSSRRLGPPPSRSAVFAAYADPSNALSTRSLPHDSQGPYARSEPAPPVPKQPKRPSLFAWTKSSNKTNLSVPKDDRSRSHSPSPVTSNGDHSISNASDSNDPSHSSFNLKSFRHVMPAASTSPTQTNASNISLATPGLSTPTPRPRGDSVYNSDSGSQQRISVAAFREAQARRSMAGSPSPSVSPLPPSPALGNDERGRNAAGPRPSRSSPHIPHSTPSTLQQKRKSGMSFARTSVYAPDSDESEEEEEDESEDDRTYAPSTTLSRKPTVKDRFGKSRAKSELGHGLARREDSFDSGNGHNYNGGNYRMGSSSSKSHLGHGESYMPTRPPMPNFQPPPPSRTQTGLSNSSASDYGGRQRASNSTSALTPSAAAKRASVVAAANAANDAEEAAMHLKRASRHVRDSSVTSNPDESLERQAKKASTHLGHGPSAVQPSTSPSNARLQSRPQAPPPQTTSSFQHQRQSAIASDSDSDSDNTPLALVAPRRPGSALSSYSTGNASARSIGGTPHAPPHKPLIDIKELTGGNTSANRSGSAPTIATLSNPHKSMEGFTGGRTLLAQVDGGSGTSSPVGSLAGRQQKPRSSSVSVGVLSQMASPSSPPDFKPPPPQKVLETPLTASPTMLPTQVTSKVPPFSFISPPNTSKEEEVRGVAMTFSSSQQQQQPDQKQPGSPKKLQKSPPPRSATMPIPTAVGTEKHRDALTERLERVVKKTVSGEQSTSSGSMGPATGSTSPSGPSVLTKRGRTMSPARATSPTQSFLTPGQETNSRPTSTFSLSPQPTHAQPRAKSLSPLPIPQPMPQLEPTSITPDESLAELLGAGVNLISLTGESDEERNDVKSGNDSDSEEESEDNYGYESVSGFRRIGGEQKGKKKGHVREETEKPKRKDSQETEEEWEKVKTHEEEAKPITPIPIKQRTPLPSFSVTSRPQVPRRPEASPQQHHLHNQGSQQSQASRQSAYSAYSASGTSVSGASSVSAASSASASGRRESVASSYSLFGASSASGNTVADTRPPNARKRSSTMIPTLTATQTQQGNGKASSPNSRGDSGNPNVDSRVNALKAVGATAAMQPQPRPRSSTMVPAMPQPVQPPPMPTMGMLPQNQHSNNPSRPFAVRRDSPASSTGESSSGRAPLTPRDGSDIGVRGRDGAPVDRESQYSGGASGLGINTKTGRGRHMKRRSVSFEDDARDLAGSGNGSGPERGRASREFLAPKNAKIEEQQSAGAKKEQEMEERRKERRREEAKAAIELGNVINGPGPTLDDDDEDMPINQVNQRMSTMNPMMLPMQQQQTGMGFGPGAPQSMSPGWGMGNMGMQMPMNMGMNMPMNMNMPPMNMNMNMNMNSGMLSPAQFMIPPPPNGDPNFMAAHQQAMMIAKQAYQMAVAQQAMAAAADEWERSSNVGAFSSAGSVYGAPASTAMMSPAAYGMMGQMQPSNWSSAGSAIFPSSRSMYNVNMSSSRSEYGGGMGGGGNGLAPNWSSSRTSYGEVGPSTGGGARGSMYGQQLYPNMPPIPQSNSSGKLGDGNGQRMRTTSTPAPPPSSSNRTGNGVRRAPPPSSWKAAI